MSEMTSERFRVVFDALAQETGQAAAPNDATRDLLVREIRTIQAHADEIAELRRLAFAGCEPDAATYTLT